MRECYEKKDKDSPDAIFGNRIVFFRTGSRQKSEAGADGTNRNERRTDVRYRKPERNPYVISSNAIATADGNIGGMPNMTDLSKGIINPTTIPY